MLKYYWADIALLEDKEKFAFWMENVNAQRREKVLRCKNQDDKKRALLAGILLCYGLENAGISYNTVEFTKAGGGKPMIASDVPIHFNISHAGNYVVCLISDEEVGIDIESLDKRIFSKERERNLLSIAKKCLADAEWKLFEESAAKSKLFIEYWTRKEAYSKCKGIGLGIDFASIDTESSKADFWSAWIEDGYCVSIYSNKRVYEELTIEKIESI